MGLFHCPVGAAFYEDMSCIYCGLCQAKTKEEAVAASKKIREYLKKNVNLMNKKKTLECNHLLGGFTGFLILRIVRKNLEIPSSRAYKLSFRVENCVKNGPNQHSKGVKTWVVFKH